MRPFLLVPLLSLAVACGPKHPSADLSRSSGVAGAGTGPSTRIALAPSPTSTNGGGTDSAQTSQGPNAGGPH